MSARSSVVLWVSFESRLAGHLWLFASTLLALGPLFIVNSINFSFAGNNEGLRNVKGRGFGIFLHGCSVPRFLSKSLAICALPFWMRLVGVV